MVTQNCEPYLLESEVTTTALVTESFRFINLHPSPRTLAAHLSSDTPRLWLPQPENSLLVGVIWWCYPITYQYHTSRTLLAQHCPVLLIQPRADDPTSLLVRGSRTAAAFLRLLFQLLFFI